MFYFLMGALFRGFEEAQKVQSEKDKKVQSSSGYVYSDYNAMIHEAKRKKNARHR